ncbi:hypothetical protein [Stutzerimonas nitrititolerans]|uniref:hypothetical protein n=1 Tax=Stutzerimonas nitrititolerans TaxID=2482751 RepID=UPI0028A700B7|nr:hypothetical protein [Stutzerimonas nitrititolerans]
MGKAERGEESVQWSKAAPSDGAVGYEETEQALRGLGSQRPEFRPTLGGELRCLRAITKVIIADMCRQVGAAA